MFGSDSEIGIAAIVGAEIQPELPVAFRLVPTVYSRKGPDPFSEVTGGNEPNSDWEFELLLEIFAIFKGRYFATFNFCEFAEFVSTESLNFSRFSFSPH